MSALVAGEAFVEVSPSFKGFVSGVDRESTKAARQASDSFNRGFDRGSNRPSAWKRVGSSMASHIGGALKTGLKVGVGGALALLGYSLTKGFQRLSSIDQATHKLEGLGNSGKQVDAIMKNALASVKGTAFGLDEAATTAAGAVAAGVKPGKDLTRTLSLTADAATIAGTSMGDMGSIFNKVATSNKIQGDVIAQLSDKGIPIVQLLSKTLHKSAGEVVDLASAGKINFAQFQTAMEKGLGGAAKKSGDTFTGAFANLKASLSRIGANLLSGIFPHLAPFTTKLTNAMAPLEDKAKVIGDKVGVWLAKGLKKLPPIIDNLKSRWREFKQGFSAGDLGPGAATFQKLGAAAKKFIDAIKGKNVGGGLDKIKTAIVGLVKGVNGQNIQQMFEGLGKSAPIFNSALKITGKALGLVADHAETVGKFLPFILAAVVAHKALNSTFGPNSLVGYNLRTAAMIANSAANWSNAAATRAATRATQQNAVAQGESTAATNSGIIATVRQRVASVASAIAQRSMAAAARIAAAGQWLLNAAMSANPIALVIIGLIALGAAFVVLWKKSETFRKIVTGAWNGIKAAASAVWTWMKTKLWPGIKWVWDKIASGFKATKDAILAAWNAIKGKFSAAWTWVSGFFKNHWKTVLAILGGPVGLAIKLIADHWSGIKGKFTAAKSWVFGAFKAAWNGVKSMLAKPVQGVKALFDREVRGWKRIFNGAKTAIGKIWSGIKGVIIKPIDGIISAINRFVRGINNLVSKIPGVSLHIPQIPHLASGGSTGAGGGRKLQGFAGGGVINGPWRGATADNVLGVSSAGVPTAWVNPREFVTNVRATRSMERNHPGALSYINATGRLPGFAGGGFLGDIWGKVKGIGSALLHPVKWIKDHLLNKLIGSIGHSLPATIAGGVLKSVVSKIGDALTGGGPGGIGINPISGAKGKLAWSGIEWFRPWLRASLVHVLRNAQRQGWSVLEMPPFGPVHRVHSAHSLHYLGQAADISTPGMRGGNSMARALAAAGFGVKWMVPGHYNHIHVDTSILDHLYGRWSHVPGYAKGTRSARPGLSWVGERGPELVRMRGGEQVYTTQQSRGMAGSAPVFNVTIHGVDTNNAGEVARTFTYEIDRQARGGRYARAL